ncbi:MAG: hypothetical protein Q4G39_08105 [Brachymonas sp.]|nr:hypothetical protein [Brachymonas sp.]
MGSMFCVRKQARWACVLAVVLLEAVPIAALAGPVVQGHDAGFVLVASRKKRSPRGSGGGGYVYPNGETATQRERRLKRECKGRPNAGACLGFGQNMG